MEKQYEVFSTSPVALSIPSACPNATGQYKKHYVVFKCLEMGARVRVEMRLSILESSKKP